MSDDAADVFIKLGAHIRVTEADRDELLRRNEAALRLLMHVSSLGTKASVWRKDDAILEAINLLNGASSVG